MAFLRAFFKSKVADQITEGQWPEARGLMMPGATA